MIMKVDLIMILVLWITLLDSVNSFPDILSKLCFHHNDFKSVFCKDQSVELSCSEHQVIRIKDIQIKKKKNGNVNSCTGCSQIDDYHILETVTNPVFFKTLLYLACSGNNKCNFEPDDILQSDETEKYIWTTSVLYGCVEKDLFKDISSSWKHVTDSVHISLRGNGNGLGECSCTIENELNNTSIEVVDYRPYINDFSCASTTFIVDDVTLFQCLHDSKKNSVYNVNIPVVNNVTNITVLFSDELPQMLWIHITGSNVTVQCNDEIFSSSLPSSVSTVHTVSRKTVTTLPETETVTEETTTEFPFIETTDPQLQDEGNADKSFFTIPIIAGGSAGVVLLVSVIAIIVCIACRRKSNRKSIFENKEENMYTEYNDQSNTDNTTTIRNGVINKSYEIEDEQVAMTLKNSSNYEEIGTIEENDNGDITEYSEPADVLSDKFSEYKATILMSKTSPQAKSHNYTEPYNNTVLNIEKENTSTKPVMQERKKGAYDTCFGIDNYSHIHVGANQTPKAEDNYSHIQIAGNKHETSCSGNYSHTKLKQNYITKCEESTDMYSHIYIDTDNQKDSVDSEKQTNGKDENDIQQDEEYDHLVIFSHH